jgi:hypothetical protein
VAETTPEAVVGETVETDEIVETAEVVEIVENIEIPEEYTSESLAGRFGDPQRPGHRQVEGQRAHP